MDVRHQATLFNAPSNPPLLKTDIQNLRLFVLTQSLLEARLHATNEKLKQYRAQAFIDDIKDYPLLVEKANIETSLNNLYDKAGYADETFSIFCEDLLNNANENINVYKIFYLKMKQYLSANNTINIEQDFIRSLLYAILAIDAESLLALCLEKRINIQQYPFVSAFISPRYRCRELIIKHCNNINERDEIIVGSIRLIATPLMATIWNNDFANEKNIKTIQSLLENGADPFTKCTIKSDDQLIFTTPYQLMIDKIKRQTQQQNSALQMIVEKMQALQADRHDTAISKKRY